MTHRFQRGKNDGAICEKYLAKLLNKEKQAAVALSLISRTGDRAVKNTLLKNQNQVIRSRPSVKQQNIHSPKAQSTSQNTLLYKDDSAVGEICQKKMSRKQRSRSSTVDRESWGQLLKQHRSGDKISMFGNFDPLRTLHFLAKELQFQLQNILPDDGTVHQMVADMQYALKRVPPEIASTVHLQQGIDTVPTKISSKTHFDKRKNIECGVQTNLQKIDEDHEKLQQIMEEGTIKLKNSCKQMEDLCTELNNEKKILENELVEAKHNNKILSKKISDLELENNEILTPRLKVLEDEKRKLENQLKTVATKLETVAQHSFNDLKSQIVELKSQKSALEQQCNNLKHQMKVFTLEREKFIAVLALRDAQINEIRSDMSQLQEVVNEQLVHLHNNIELPEIEVDDIDKSNSSEKQDFYDDVALPVAEELGYFTPQQNVSFKDLNSGDDVFDFITEDSPKKQKSKTTAPPTTSVNLTGKLKSQATIRMMFNELKETAYAVVGDSKGSSQ